MMTLTILDILLIFIVFCTAWIINQVGWKIIEGKMLIKRQNDMIDALYAKGIRLALKAINDYKQLKEVVNRDKM